MMERAAGLVVVQDAMFLAQRIQLAELAAKNRLPAIYGIEEHVRAGGLMAYAASRPEIFRRAATFVAKILRGAEPSDIPVEQPTKFDLVINLTAAKALGLQIPEKLLALADEVIE
jgi:putative ABC transport system substrate-binding protein